MTYGVLGGGEMFVDLKTLDDVSQMDGLPNLGQFCPTLVSFSLEDIPLLVVFTALTNKLPDLGVCSLPELSKTDDYLLLPSSQSIEDYD